MPTIIPHSYYYGDSEFPWGGRIQPGLYQIYTWLLQLTAYYPAHIPIIDASTPFYISGAERTGLSARVSQKTTGVSVRRSTDIDIISVNTKSVKVS